MTAVESGYGSGSHVDPHDQAMYQQELASPLVPDIPGHMPQQGDYIYGLGVASQSDALAGVGVGAGPLADSGGSSREPDFGVHAADSQYGLSVLSHAAAAVEFVRSPSEWTRVAAGIDSGRPLIGFGLPTPVEPYRSVPQVFIDQYEIGRDSPETATAVVPWSPRTHDWSRTAHGDATTEPVDLANGEGGFKCPQPGCGKSRKRECDLRYVQAQLIPRHPI